MLVQPERLTNRTTNTIALDGAARVLDRNGQPEARPANIIRHRSHCEKSITKPPSARIGGLEIGFAPQATLRGMSKPPSHRSSCGK
jgi:hypothetical protein